MDRRTFLIRSSVLAGGALVAASLPAWAQKAIGEKTLTFDSDLYRRFSRPRNVDKPFVRWWWNGNKVETDELVRELRLLHEAGIGGVEINPVKFPEETDDLGKPTLRWLSDPWVDALGATFDEAKRLGMVCDLIVGSGWPFGGEYLQGEELGQVMVVAVKKIKGPVRYECSLEDLYLEADPAVNNPYNGRTMKMYSLKLVPDPVGGLDQVRDLSDQIGSGKLSVEVPEGDHALYALIKVTAFMQVINGVAGANGPVLNHFDKQAVLTYLDRMADAIEKRTGPLGDHIRAFFIDGLELEGANWTADMRDEFIRRRGYDPMPYLPFTMYKTGGMGNVLDYHYGAAMTPEFQDTVERVRYDFCLTQAELLDERFFKPFTDWTHSRGVISRVQAYGRGTFPLNSSLYCDIPEGESWTTNYLKHRPGEEMSNEDYRRGRAYTMINKFVSSGAHLAGKRVVSAEDMTNTYDVFSATLELLKLGSDQSVIAGITHSVFHGFNYSPPEAPFPGWIRYGAYYNENNNWWPYYKYFTAYKARLSAVLHEADMVTRIGILPPVADMWSTMGMQNEPFPSRINVPYLSLVWEAMCKHGDASDYLSDEVIRAAEVKGGKLCYGPKAYDTIFLVAVERIHPAELEKLLAFVAQGGRVFCVEKTPHLSLGLHEREANDARVRELVAQLEAHSDRFVRLDVPADNDFMTWYAEVQRRYGLKPYVEIGTPNPFVMQNRYRTSDGQEMVFVVNSHRYDAHRTTLTFAPELTRGRYPWVWNLVDGTCYRVGLSPQGGIEVDLGPTDSLLFVFNKQKNGPRWQPLPVSGPGERKLDGWKAELRHSREGWVKTIDMDELRDLKETEYINFTGTVLYRKRFEVSGPSACGVLNLGRVAGVAEVKLNGAELGVSWCGRRLYDLAGKLRRGGNELEVKVVTTLGNYMRTLTENPTAQKWTAGRKEQPDQSMGLIGPVTLYGK